MKLLTRTLFVCALSALLAGCNSGSRSSTSTASTGAGSTATPSSSTTGSTTSGNTNTPPATPDLTAIPASAQPASPQRTTAGDLVAFTFGISAGANDVELNALELASAGTVDESTLGEARWIEDTNANGVFDQGEPVLATASAAAADDAPYAFSPQTPVVISAGATASYLIVVDASQATQIAQLAMVGKTLELSIADASKIDAMDPAGSALTPAGSYPLAGSAVTLEFGEHVLISEVAVGPGSGATSAEFVELVNPTAQVIDLENYYLTDYTDDPTNGNFYWKIPRGDQFGPAASTSSADFVVRFPAGAQIQPGEVITVAIDGVGYQAAYAVDATYCMRNPGATASIQMRSWDGVVTQVAFTQTPISNNAGLTNNGEFVCLYTWDGTADLVQDVDLLNYGTSTLTNTSIDKSPNQTAPGAPDVRIDSLFDADNVQSTYQPEKDDLFQFNNRAPRRANELCVVRVDFTEGQEVKTGGNGLTGNDETSEDLGDGAGNAGTFDSTATATPGTLQ